MSVKGEKPPAGGAGGKGGAGGSRWARVEGGRKSVASHAALLAPCLSESPFSFTNLRLKKSQATKKAQVTLNPKP